MKSVYVETSIISYLASRPSRDLRAAAWQVRFAARILAEGGVPPNAEADAVHLAVACVHEVDYLLTWNCRHIDNAATKPLIRSLAAVEGYACPEICTPLELFSEDDHDPVG